MGKLDWSAVVIYLVMVLMGLFNIYSAAYLPDHPSLFDFAMPYGKQVMWIGVSIFLAALILLLEGNFIRKQAYIPYLVVLVLLVVVLFMPEVNGAHSWLGIGLFGVQPSEFAKFATALALARFLSTINIKIQDFRSRMYSGLLIIVPAILIYIQPDPGTMLVFVSFVLVLYREGLSGNILLFTFLAVALGLTTILMKFNEIEIPGFGIQIDGFIAIFIFFGILSLLGAFFIQQFVRKRARKRAFTLLLVGFLAISGFVFTVDSVYDKGLKDRHRNRIELYLGLKQDPDGDDYNRNRAMAAVGSGGLTGKGYKSATLANARHKHVPEQSTDFIFCTLSEEWGFLGGLSIISLFMIFTGAAGGDCRKTTFSIHQGLCLRCTGDFLYPLYDQYWYDDWPGAGNRYTASVF